MGYFTRGESVRSLYFLGVRLLDVAASDGCGAAGVGGLHARLLRSPGSVTLVVIAAVRETVIRLAPRERELIRRRRRRRQARIARRDGREKRADLPHRKRVVRPLSAPQKVPQNVRERGESVGAPWFLGVRN